MPFCKHLILASSLLLTSVASMANQTFSSDQADFQLEIVAQDLEHPWSLAFLPDGSSLLTERVGRLRVIRNGQLLDTPVDGLPEPVVSGQGGLLEVLLHRDFENNQVLFLSYAHRSREGMTTRVARARFNDDRLTDVAVIFQALPRSNTSRHFAGRMEFDRDGNLYVAVGDRGEMDRAQDTGDDAGGVHRITTDGHPAPGWRRDQYHPGGNQLRLARDYLRH